MNPFISCNIGNAIASCKTPNTSSMLPFKIGTCSVQQHTGCLHNKAKPNTFIIPYNISGQLQSTPHPDDILFRIHLGF